jgi:predicted esterase
MTRTLVSILALVALAGCGQSSDASTPSTSAPTTTASGTAPVARFVVPADLAALDGEHWLDHPWPSDLRREKDGSIRLDGFPNTQFPGAVAGWVKDVKGAIRDYSPVAAGFFSFEGPIDPAKLPADAKGSLDASATLQLVDVDPKSPHVGERVPLEWKWHEPVGYYLVAANTLAFAPALGASMRRGGRYAAVVTRELTGPGGAAAPSEALASLLAGEGPLAASWGPALDALDQAGVPRARIAHLAVFTVGDPFATATKLAAHARKQPLPALKTLSLEKKDDADYDQYTGVYAGAPDYQVGTPPYSHEGGQIAYDDAGEPVVQRKLEQRFKLLVPKADKCKIPDGGYPIVLYAHGTGGSWTSLVETGTGPALAKKCLASMGVDQPFHGARPGAPPEDDPNAEDKEGLSFFNVNNANAIRHNNLQAAIDEVMRARFVASGGLAIAKDVSATGAAIAFDPKRVAFYGHSQGTFNGAMFLALDENLAHGAVLSGSCSSIAHWTMLRVNIKPSVPNLIKIVLGIPADAADELGPLNPAVALLQTIADPSDPIHAYPHLVADPLPGHAPKSVLLTEGIAPDGSGDDYVPPVIQEGNAAAGGFPLLSPVVRDVPLLTKALGIPVATPPVTGNLAGGKATAGIAQFVPSGGVDGHYVARQGKALEMTMSFEASLVASDVPTIPAP